MPPNPNIHLKSTTASTVGNWSSKSLGLFLTVYSHEQKNNIKIHYGYNITL